MLTNAMMILTAPPPDNWKRQLGRIHITWLNTVQCDLRAYNLTLNDAVDLAQNRPLYRLMSAYGATHSLWCMPHQKNTKPEEHKAVAVSGAGEPSVISELVGEEFVVNYTVLLWLVSESASGVVPLVPRSMSPGHNVRISVRRFICG